MKVNLDMHFNFQAIKKTLQLLFDVELLLRLIAIMSLFTIVHFFVKFFQLKDVFLRLGVIIVKRAKNTC
jgi:hypothetical protein